MVITLRSCCNCRLAEDVVEGEVKGEVKALGLRVVFIRLTNQSIIIRNA